MKKVLGRGEKSKGILSRQQHWDNSVSDTLGSRSGFDKDPHPTEQLDDLLSESFSPMFSQLATRQEKP